MSENISTNWPPPYALKKHARARHVKLKVSVKKGLEIVVPTRFSKTHIPRILEENKSWIEKKLNEICDKISKAEQDSLPTEIALSAINQIWKITYLKTYHEKIKLFTRPEQELVLMGNVDNKTLCKKILILWLKNQAQHHLENLLKEVSKEIHLSFNSVTIRSQQTRWGSCSTDKSISLNYKLILLPRQLTRHILIHELCHTVHMNHSSRFWRLVASFDPLWKEHSRDTRKSDHHLPAWLI